MFPIPSKLTSLDLYRDGGSLSVSFLAEDGVEHILLFRINLRVDAEQRIEALGYFAPVLEKFVDVERVSRISGRTTIDVRKDSTRLSWEEALQLLEKMTPLMSEFASEYGSVFEQMQEIAALNCRAK